MEQVDSSIANEKNSYCSVVSEIKKDWFNQFSSSHVPNLAQKRRQFSNTSKVSLGKVAFYKKWRVYMTDLLVKLLQNRGKSLDVDWVDRLRYVHSPRALAAAAVFIFSKVLLSLNEWLNWWMNDKGNEWMTKRLITSLNYWMTEWVNEWIND